MGTMMLGLVLACGESTAPEAPPVEPEKLEEEEVDARRESAKALLGPIPDEARVATRPLTDELVALGKVLYFEPRLSISGEMSCNTCHTLDNYGVDNEPTSPGHEGKRGDRNSPTVYNAAFHVAQFWDGRAADVEEQATGPILNPIEMGMPSADVVVDKLNAIEGYDALFAAAFPGQEDPITIENVGVAIGAFERRLVTPAPFDRWLEGDDEALTDEQKKGYEVFTSSGCTSCHLGPAVGGSMYQKLGLVAEWPGVEDVGRAKVTGNEAERHFFKVPSLRNVTKTGPWLHDGSVTDLDEMIVLMGRHQLGRELSEQDVAAIRAFLDSLTGELPASLVEAPELPGQG